MSALGLGGATDAKEATMTITPNFAALAAQWLKDARHLAAEGPHSPRDLLQHDAWGRLLIRHGWLTPDGTRATGSGTVATPAEVFAAMRGDASGDPA
jgi:hypothetical protein